MKINILDKKIATILGAFSIIFWSSTVAFSRNMMSSLGVLQAASYVYLLGGIVGCANLLAVPAGFKKIGRMPRSYLYLCGGLFVLYSVCLYIALGFASNNQQAVEVGIINYMWPGLALAFSVPIIGNRARWPVVPGIIIAFAGMALATTANLEEPFSLTLLKQNVGENLGIYLLALTAAITWALYSNLSRRLAGDCEGNAVPVFVLATGLVFAAASFFMPYESVWTWQAVFELGYTGILTTFIAYGFWDYAMRRGNVIVVISLSYFIPFLSVLTAVLYLGLDSNIWLWVACGLVIAGAVICNYSVTERKPSTQQQS